MPDAVNPNEPHEAPLRALVKQAMARSKMVPTPWQGLGAACQGPQADLHRPRRSGPRSMPSPNSASSGRPATRRSCGCGPTPGPSSSRSRPSTRRSARSSARPTRSRSTPGSPQHRSAPSTDTPDLVTTSDRARQHPGRVCSSHGGCTCAVASDRALLARPPTGRHPLVHGDLAQRCRSDDEPVEA